MLTPKELEIESLYLNMLDNPQVAKILYSFLAENLNDIINDLVDNGAAECTGEQVVNSLIECRDNLRQVSAL